MDELPTAVAIESLFRDVYTILEEIQGSADQLEPVAEPIAISHWTIQNLERLYRTQTQAHNPSIPNDVFDISRNLERFVASCSSLTYSHGRRMSSAELQIGCMFGVPRQTKKRNQIRELQEEFWDHQRMLSMVLANAIYMTTLDMQKERQSADPALASILRQSQKRHTVYERCDKGQEGKAQKPSESRADHLEWEFCVRRYFEYVDARNKAAQRSFQERQGYGGQLVRCGSEPNLALALAPPPGRSECRTMTSTSEFSYGSYRRGESLNTESRIKRLSADGDPYNAIYTRSRRNSTASNVSASTVESRTNSFTSSHGISPMVSPTAMGFPRLPAGGVPYDRSQSAGPTLGHPRATGGDNLQQAWIDITNATRDMPPNEARAYTQGRLEGLDPALVAQLRFMEGEFPSHPPLPARQNSAPPPPRRDSLPRPLALDEPSEEVPLDQNQRRSQMLRVTNLESRKGEVSKAVRSKTTPNAQKRLPRRSSKNRVSGLRADHQRQLSTIVERPMTAGSKKSKAESTKSLKSIFSLKKEMIPPVPEIPRIKVENRKPSDESLSDSSTLRGSTPDKIPRIVELDDSPSKIPNRPALQKSSLRHRSNLSSKPLPMRPDQFPLCPLVEEAPPHTNNPIKILSRIFSATKKERSLHARLSSKSTPHLGAGMRSAESLVTKASLDAMSRKNGSKSTICLVAIQEAPDQPFQVWLNALPYIEGRAGTPTPVTPRG